MPMPVAHEYHDASIVQSLETRIMLQSLNSFPNLESFKLDLGGWDLAKYEEGCLGLLVRTTEGRGGRALEKVNQR